MMVKCPETIEELEELQQKAELWSICGDKAKLLRDAKLASGAAYSKREAERQISEETGAPLGTIRREIWEAEKVARGEPPCETELQADEGPAPICAIWTGDQEWNTPSKYIEAARGVMGSIDLDPASNELAQETVKATTFFTKEESGLDKPWEGNIFLNPPYSHPDVKYFVDKLLTELKPGQQAILLTNNNTDTNFFHDAARKASALCFTKGRISFQKPDGSYSSPTNGQVFYYFGDNKEKFIKTFSKFGILMEVV